MGLIRSVVKFLLSAFFDRRHLSGRFFDETRGGYVWAVRSIWVNSVLRVGKPCPWPTAATCLISNPNNLRFHPDDLNNFQSPGTYFQNMSEVITIGRGTYIAPNVGIITANHLLSDLSQHSGGQPVTIGENCWIGMNSVILPGVVLGPRTIVGAGSVVTKSFIEGGVTIAGSPARPIAAAAP